MKNLLGSNSQRKKSNNNMAIGTPWKRLDKKDGYDAIAIGSGLGSMTFGSIMAQMGKKVLLLEKHYVPGGFTHIFKRKEYEWDVGIHYVGDVHKDFTFISILFAYITEHKLKWQEMDEVYGPFRLEIGPISKRSAPRSDLLGF